MLDKLKALTIPILALITVLLAGEFILRINGDFNKTYPYHDYFFGKQMQISNFKGEPWAKKEYENKLIRNQILQHVRDLPNLEQSKNIIFLLGDSITESSSTSKDASFHAQADDRNNDIDIVAFHFAGCSLKALVFELDNYAVHLVQNSKIYKPNYAILQIRALSYVGGNTSFFDPQSGTMVDYQEKLPTDNLEPWVQAKKDFLANFSLNLKFSDKFQDKYFRDLVLGDSHFLSLLAWKFFHWTQQASTSFPNNEELTKTQSIEDLYWQRFERSVALLKQVSDANAIPVGVILIPEPDWFRLYEHTKKYNKYEKKYQEIFAKYNIPFEYSIEEMYETYQRTKQAVFWQDNHPSIIGSQAIAVSLENLLKRLIH